MADTDPEASDNEEGAPEMTIRSITELRRVAAQAQAENDSGVLAGDVSAQRYLDGVEEALRWAAGDSTTEEIAQLIERVERVNDQGGRQ